MHGTNDGAAAGDDTASTRSGGVHDWGALDAELDERLDRDESAPTNWGDHRVALEPGERFKGFLRGTTPNPTEGRHNVVLLDDGARTSVHVWVADVAGELETSGARPGDMVAIGRRIEDGVNARGQSYPYLRVRSRPVDREIGSEPMTDRDPRSDEFLEAMGHVAHRLGLALSLTDSLGDGAKRNSRTGSAGWKQAQRLSLNQQAAVAFSTRARTRNACVVASRSELVLVETDGPDELLLHQPHASRDGDGGVEARPSLLLPTPTRGWGRRSTRSMRPGSPGRRTAT